MKILVEKETNLVKFYADNFVYLDGSVEVVNNGTTECIILCLNKDNCFVVDDVYIEGFIGDQYLWEGGEFKLAPVIEALE